MLEGRVNCFLYSKQQERLAGQDGEKEFNKVFAEEARTVAVFHRGKWGSTPWTRIEETAIRNRAFEEGYEFVYFIPMDSNDPVPKWLPKTQIWISIERWGIDGVATVLEARVQQYGGEVKHETFVDYVKKAKDGVEGELGRKRLLDSYDGLTLAKGELEWINSHVIEQVEKLIKSVDGWHITHEKNKQDSFNLISYGMTLSVQWYLQYGNSLNGAYLRVALFKGVIGRGYFDPAHRPRVLDEDRLQFDINGIDQNGWSDKGNGRNFRTSQKLIEHWLKAFLDAVVKKRKEENY